MVKLFLPATLFILLIGTYSCAQESSWSVLATDDYTVSYPSKWTVDQSGTMGTEFFIYDAPTEKGDLFSENINLTIQELMTDTITLEMYGDMSKNMLSNYMTDYKFISSDIIRQNNTKLYTLEYFGKTGQFDLYYYQLLAAKGEFIYILTFTAERDQAEAYQEQRKKITASFRMK